MSKLEIDGPAFFNDFRVGDEIYYKDWNRATREDDKYTIVEVGGGYIKVRQGRRSYVYIYRQFDFDVVGPDGVTTGWRFCHIAPRERIKSGFAKFVERTT